MVETTTQHIGDVTVLEMAGRLHLGNSLSYAENSINRLIDGTRENTIPGDSAAWNQVTNVGNCQPNFTPPSAANGGAQGPCYAAGVNPVRRWLSGRSSRASS